MIIQITVLGFITIFSIYYVNYIIPIITKFISLSTYNIFFTNILILVQLDNFTLFNELNNLKINKINEINEINKTNEINGIIKTNEIFSNSYNLKNIYKCLNSKIQKLKKTNSNYF